jgi:hypothetical protein
LQMISTVLLAAEGIPIRPALPWIAPTSFASGLSSTRRWCPSPPGWLGEHQDPWGAPSPVGRRGDNLVG